MLVVSILMFLESKKMYLTFTVEYLIMKQNYRDVCKQHLKLCLMISLNCTVILGTYGEILYFNISRHFDDGLSNLIFYQGDRTINISLRDVCFSFILPVYAVTKTENISIIFKQKMHSPTMNNQWLYWIPIIPLWLLIKRPLRNIYRNKTKNLIFNYVKRIMNLK